MRLTDGKLLSSQNSSQRMPYPPQRMRRRSSSNVMSEGAVTTGVCISGCLHVITGMVPVYWQAWTQVVRATSEQNAARGQLCTALYSAQIQNYQYNCITPAALQQTTGFSVSQSSSASMTCAAVTRLHDARRRAYPGDRAGVTRCSLRPSMQGSPHVHCRALAASSMHMEAKLTSISGTPSQCMGN